MTEVKVRLSTVASAIDSTFKRSDDEIKYQIIKCFIHRGLLGCGVYLFLFNRGCVVSKFKVGDKAYFVRCGVCVIDRTDAPDNYPIRIIVDHLQYSFALCGKFYLTDLNPSLLTLDEARAKGYDVPAEPKPKVKMYLYAYLAAGTWRNTSYYYTDDIAFTESITKTDEFIRLDNTMIEVEGE